MVVYALGKSNALQGRRQSVGSNRRGLAGDSAQRETRIRKLGERLDKLRHDKKAMQKLVRVLLTRIDARENKRTEELPSLIQNVKIAVSNCNHGSTAGQQATTEQIHKTIVDPREQPRDPVRDSTSGPGRLF